MAKKQEKPVEETEKELSIEKQEEETVEDKAIPTEEDLKKAKTPEDKLKLMKKLLANQKVAEPVKQKHIYEAMPNITVVRNY